jgi:phosphoribosylanthranilate isomerase
MIRVKICGINSEAAFDASIEARADLLGFVFFPRSPRFVTPRQGAALSARHQGGPLRVGLFVEPTEDDVKAVLDVMKLDKLQLYASPDTCRALKRRFGVMVGHAIGVETAQELPPEADGIDCLVVEAKAPIGATRPGGNAAKLDWSLTKAWRAPVPWLLAGGLTPDNVAEAIAQSGAPGVDVSSGVESLPGVKSPALIRRFIANARGAGRRGVVSKARGLRPLDPR